MEYVNVFGDPVAIDPSRHAKPKKKREQPESFHNGWRVIGIPPGELEEARSSHAKAVKAAQTQGSALPKPWDEETWLMNFKKRAVRSKPYVVPAAADLCKQLAEGAGWLRVEVVEIKREAA